MPKVIENVSERISKHPGKLIVWFGYDITHWVDSLHAALTLRNQRIDYVVDNARHKWGRVSFNGIIISPPEYTIKTNIDKVVVFVLSNHTESMVKQLKGFGLNDNQIEIFPAPYKYSDKAEDAFKNEISGLKRMDLRELQLCEFDILKALKKFCDAQGLRYYLSGGTCFGAVQYKGFVPWDDDIDIFMPYADFMALVKTYPKNGRYKIVYWEEHNDFLYPYIRMIDNSTVNIYGSFPISFLTGVFIDIVPLVGFPEQEDELRYRFELIPYLEGKWRWYYNARGVQGLEACDLRAEVWKQKCELPFDESPMAGEMSEFGRGDEPWILPQSSFGYGETLEFEGEQFSVIKDWREYLARRYKNWGNKSQKELEVKHPIKAFWKYR
jgi:phosphorylcholine metabolism protein LicD